MKLRRAVKALLNPPLTPSPEAVAELQGELHRLAAETTQLRSALELVRAEQRRSEARVNASQSHAAQAAEAFDAHVRRWVAEAIEANANTSGILAAEGTTNAIAAYERRLRRLERSSQVPAGADGASSSPAQETLTTTDTPTSTPAPTPTPAPTAVASTLTQSFSYDAFEDELRGPISAIRELQSEYLDLINSLPNPELQVLDVGCGRGEFLDLLREQKVDAMGIDMNPVFVADCIDEGLTVHEAEAIAYLEATKPASLRAIVAFHVIEHLDFAQQFRFMSGCLKALSPGGVMVLETPNPENLSVGAHTFWLDPTHVRALPPKLLEFQAKDIGFDAVEILRLHRGAALEADLELEGDVATLAARVSNLLTGPQDYAIVARVMT